MLDNDTVRTWVEGVAIPLVGIPGVLGNLMAIAVMLSKKLMVIKSIRHLFIQLAVFDTLLLITHMIALCPGHWFEYYRKYYE